MRMPRSDAEEKEVEMHDRDACRLCDWEEEKEEEEVVAKVTHALMGDLCELCDHKRSGHVPFFRSEIVFCSVGLCLCGFDEYTDSIKGNSIKDSADRPGR